MSLYNLKTDTAAQSYSVEQYIITKFDSDLNVEASYLTSKDGCTCPAGIRPSCRHRAMLPNLRQRADTAWFWDFAREAWVDPTGEANKPAAESEAQVDEDQASDQGPPPEHMVDALAYMFATLEHIKDKAEADQVSGTGPDLVEADQASSSVEADQASHPRAHAQSLAGAIESGAIKLVPEAKAQPTFRRRI